MSAWRVHIAGRPWPGPELLQRLWQEKRLGSVCGAIILVFVLCGVFAGTLAPSGFNDVDPINRLQAPSGAHLLGTDNLGRDLLSRCLYAARISLLVGIVSALLGTLISVVMGILSGYFGGAVDQVLQRLVDAWMTFPALIVLIVVASIFGAGTPQIILTLSVLLGIGGSRVIRSAVLVLREQAYVRAARGIGASNIRILRTHVLPNVTAPILVLFTTRVGAAILAESGLSFLGLGVPPPTPTWGGMLTGSGRSFMFQAPWLVLAPGLCLTIVVYAFNMFGDALRDLLDPRMRLSS